ncbi:signal transduction histidine kinase [Cupriavidus metallidurans]|jgi:signal transduction histidine kinase|uniref:histidine kinase n=1 Tax=Cupriavidus metallidurans (strain ATCC 43123 / DSM 2839 / NBRC 102507 / CH34) TaxID=266264 RepID=Q1LHM8_CUPMC|nr:ATP-binding protein [Cupriavidus metallidurans]ABF10348.1 Periplasmic sensor signal transduction histidine kinase [Cupriavidus metallidurans CH34]KWW33729.1 Osmolarity sensor protein EnvZ [Cupriavidus metallidurans]MDE4919818.1 ATP-binding protein [Cupriavidus metallidurans]QGS28884.1 HAMP domain-containing protein [Cupriavidus metallidurans]
MAAQMPPSADDPPIVRPELRSSASETPRRRFDSMFVRLFFVMAAIMLAVHVLGVTVIEGFFPRPGSERYMERMRRAASEAEAAGHSLPAPLPGALASLSHPHGPPPPPNDDDDDGDNDGPPLHPDAFRMQKGGVLMPPGPPGPPGPPSGFHIRGLWPPHLGMLFQLVAILIASWVGARLLARPVQQLASGANRLAQDVHAPPLEEEMGPAEARDATRALNLMQQRIRTQLAQQSRFLAAVSHDLRTPLTRMSLRIERIEDNNVRYRLRQDLAEMNGLIDATLYYLRERDDAAGPRQRVDVLALLQAIVDDAQEMGQDVRLSGTAVPLLAYPAELRRAVVNLVENAHRYGGAAHIVLTDSAERVIIDVSDNGPGIPPAELQRVLEPFYRVESSRSRATGGVGMGLAIAADIVARHGGELTLSNRTEGGLRVRIVLPRA